jgi:hypothetical protein
MTEEKKPSKAEKKKPTPKPEPSKAEEKKPSKGDWHGGKGSRQRSRRGDQKKYADAWDKIWGKTHEGSAGTDRNPPSGT